MPATLLVVGLVLTACTVQSRTSDTASAFDTPVPPVANAPAEREPDDVDVLSARPVDDAMIALFGTTDVSLITARLDRDVVEAVTQCMAERGFTYAAPHHLTVPLDERNRMDPTFISAHGFGIVNDFRELAAWRGGAALVGPEDNDVHLAQLRPVERERWLVALDGTPSTTPGQLPEGDGCREKGRTEALMWWTLVNESLPISGMAEERDTHPRMLEAMASWRECMADDGHEFLEPSSIETDVRRRVRELAADLNQPGAALIVGGRLELTEATIARLNELERYEISVAERNRLCRDEISETLDAVEREVQQAFAERHAEALAKLRAAN